MGDMYCSQVYAMGVGRTPCPSVKVANEFFRTLSSFSAYMPRIGVTRGSATRRTLGCSASLQHFRQYGELSSAFVDTPTPETRFLIC